MANKKLQMKEYNTTSAQWDTLQPVTAIQYVDGVTTSAETFLGTPSTHNLRQMLTSSGTGSLIFGESATLTYSTINYATITASTISNAFFIAPSLGTATANSINAVSMTASTSGITLRNNTASIVRTGTGSLSFVGSTASYTISNGGFLLAASSAPSANEGYVLQVVGGTPSWVSAGSISGSVDITGALEISSNLTVKGNTTLTTSLNGVVIATAGLLSAGSASLVNQVTGTLPVGRGGSGATTLTGVLVGNGASAFTAVTAPSGTIVGTTDTQVLSNKTFNLSQNTMTGSLAQFNTALIGADFASLAGVETLTNKTIDLGNNTLTGSFAELNIAVGGTLLSENSTNIGITAKTFDDNGITFQDNGDNSRKMQFQLSAITAGTTVSITIPDIVSGTMLTTNNTATLINKSINGNNNTLTNIDLTSAVTGTLPVANGGTGVTSKTGTGNVVLSANSVLTGTTTASTISATSLILANALPESEGGTGESSYTSGQILIGDSSGELTKAFISGTTNEVNVTTASAAITIGLPNIVSITGLNISARLTASSINVGTIVGPTGFSDGTVGNPGINFTSDTDTGMYRSATNTLNFATNGIERLQIDTTQFTIVPQIVNLESYNSGVGSGKAVYVSSTGVFGYLISTQKAKKDITSFNFDKNKFLELQPKSFKIKEEYGGNGTTQIGFIAEDADLLGLNYLVAKDSNGDIETFNYDKLSIYLMSIVKDQQEQIKSLVTRIEALEGN